MLDLSDTVSMLDKTIKGMPFSIVLTHKTKIIDPYLEALNVKYCL